MARASSRVPKVTARQSLQSVDNNGTRKTRSAVKELASTKPESPSDAPIREETVPLKQSRSARKRPSNATSHSPSKKPKLEPPSSDLPPPTQSKTTSPNTTQTLRARKLASYTRHALTSPFPTHPEPSAASAKLAHRILASLHGPRTRPTTTTAPTTASGCGASASVLDALVRTILSQNTSDTNSTRAKLAMDAVYGRSDNWPAIVAGGPAKLQQTIQCGGLSHVKSRVILNILSQVHADHGAYSLEHLRAPSSAAATAATTALLAFDGVGPKTAACVLLFCLGTDAFAVDTHVWRLSRLLGWVPPGATREATQAHLDLTVPDEDKYGLHVLMVTHGRRCVECRAGGTPRGTCPLRAAFARKPKAKAKGKGDDDDDDDEVEQ